MIIKHISYVLLLFFTHCIHASPFATRLMLESTSTNQPVQHKNPLFIQARKSEAEFMHACKECLQTNDCRTHKQCRQARQSVISSIVDLISYINSFEDDAMTDIDEKNEAESIKNQLIHLLEHATKR